MNYKHLIDAIKNTVTQKKTYAFTAQASALIKLTKTSSSPPGGNPTSCKTLATPNT